MMTEGLMLFLKSLNLEQHFEMFLAKGFDSESDICHLNSEDLDSMYISEDRDRKQILEAAPHFKPSKESFLYEWLRKKGLDHYFIGFVQSDLIELSDIARLNLPDADLYDELEITLPGHKRRLERAVRQLAKKLRMSIPTFSSSVEPVPTKESTSKISDTAKSSEDKMEIPVAYGRWGKPKCLLEAKYDFLILDATVASTKDPLDRVQIEFMVDSGSDVVTLREEVLDSLDLELIGPIKSQGVHASKTKNLYRANMIVGNQLLEIEVMGESYDSIGSRVIRHFRHYITGNRHIWLKGDYRDLTVKSSQETHEGEGQSVTTEASQATISQETSGERPKTSPQEAPLLLSAKTSGGEPEEHELLVESEQIDEEGMDVTENAKVQKDSGVINGDVKYVPKHPEVNVDTLKFSFKTSDDGEINVRKEGDETDLLLEKDNEIIDVRPFIEANRAKHVKSFQEQPAVRYLETGIQLGKETLENGMDELPFSIPVSGRSAAHVPKLEENFGETFLSQRTVYYRSQPTEKQNGQNSR